MPLALVTGAAHGIGAALARRLVKRGDSVIVTDVDDVAGRMMASHLGESAQFFRLDVADSGDWHALREQILEHHGRLDTLVLNAGVLSRPQGARDDDDAMEWLTHRSYERVMSVNQTGVVNGLLTCMPLLLDQGAGQIVVISSVDALIAYPQDPFYAMTKASQLSLVRSLAPLLAPSGVTINAVCPYAVSTDLTPENYHDVPGRGISPAEFAEAVEFVLSSDSSGEVWLKHDASRAPIVHSFAPVVGIDRLYE